MLVTAVVPARNAEAYLAEAIASVLNQTLPPEEVIVVDDGSTDTTADVAESFGEPVRCIRQAPAGIGAAVNRGIEHARGAFLSFLDADDLWMAEKNEIQLRALSGPDQLDMVFGHVRQFLSPELTAAERERLILPPGLVPGLVRGAMLVRRDAFERVGQFATQWRMGEFVDWYARALDAGLRGAMLPDLVLRRRLHRDNNGIRTSAVRGDYAHVLKAVLDRRRAEAT